MKITKITDERSQMVEQLNSQPVGRRTAPFPSPQPSPTGRGRIVVSQPGNRRPLAPSTIARRCSLSLGERAGVRGNGAQNRAVAQNLVWRLGIACVVLALLTGCGGQSQSTSNAKDEQLYTCGMHPTVIQNKPGNCPICGMKLTPIRRQAFEHGSAELKNGGERKIKYYKSTIAAGEVSPTPRKDSMGMEMTPVYEDEAQTAASATITIDPVTT